MTVDSEFDLTALKRMGKIVALILQELINQLCPGMTTAELDEIGEKFLKIWCPIRTYVSVQFPRHYLY